MTATPEVHRSWTRIALASLALAGAAEHFLYTAQVSTGDRASAFGNTAMTAVCLMMAARVLWCRGKVTDARIVANWLLCRLRFGWHLIRAVNAGHGDMRGALIPGRTVIVALCDVNAIALWWATTVQAGANACAGELSRRRLHRLETASHTVRSGGRPS